MLPSDLRRSTFPSRMHHLFWLLSQRFHYPMYYLMKILNGRFWTFATALTLIF